MTLVELTPPLLHLALGVAQCRHSMYVYKMECKLIRNWYFVAVAWSYWIEESLFLLPVAIYPLALTQSVLLILQLPGQPPYYHFSLYPFHPPLVFYISTPQSTPPQCSPASTLSGLSHLPPHRRSPALSGLLPKMLSIALLDLGYLPPGSALCSDILEKILSVQPKPGPSVGGPSAQFTHFSKQELDQTCDNSQTF